jgi:Tfp pilus assembly protein FimV
MQEDGASIGTSSGGEARAGTDLLARAQAAFERGDHRAVRQLCRRLEQASDPAVRTGAADLRRRLTVDPAQIVVLVSCLALFLVIVYVYVLA